jgi:hypothetical protein
MIKKPTNIFKGNPTIKTFICGINLEIIPRATLIKIINAVIGIAN